LTVKLEMTTAILANTRNAPNARAKHSRSSRFYLIMRTGAVSARTAIRFAMVAALGCSVGYALYYALLTSGLSALSARASSFLCVTILSYALNSRWSFSYPPAPSTAAEWQTYGRYLAISFMALSLGGGVAELAQNVWGLPHGWVLFFNIVIGVVITYLASAFYVFPLARRRISANVRWRILAVGTAIYAVLLRLIYMRIVNLMPEEAYYWNYAQHLDFGYLDHPPMVAWLISLSTQVLGNNEFAVRASALVLWFVTVALCFQLTRNLYGKTAAFVSMLFLSAMPFFFATGFLMMPDAPLTAAWAGSLLFLERVFFADRRTAWLGAGIFLGLGLISKYSIALLGPAIVLFMLIDPKARAWFRSPWPYAGAALAFLILSPVVVWNATHEWASFLFQSVRRAEEPFRFSLHMLLLSVIVLLTPSGVMSAWLAFLRGRSSADPLFVNADRRWLFAAIFTIVPLSVFVTFSLLHSVKLNWTGPVWLAALPTMASFVTTEESRRGVIRQFTSQRSWALTTASIMMLFAGTFHYIAVGLPGFPSRIGSHLRDLPIAWKEFGDTASEIDKRVQTEIGEDPLIVGMDRYFVASELAFYDGDHDGAQEAAGRKLFGLESLMYDYWFPAAKQNGRTMILFGLEPYQLRNAAALRHFRQVGPIKSETIRKGQREVGVLYYRVGYDYQSDVRSLTHEPESHP
jgi:dolichol-phosphate mannosyltransferase